MTMLLFDRLADSLALHPADAMQIDPDVCAVCFEHGELVACGCCDRGYHLQCVQLRSAPRGVWKCPIHHCKQCSNEVSKEAVSCTYASAQHNKKARKAARRCISCARAYCVQCQSSYYWSHEWWVCKDCAAPAERVNTSLKGDAHSHCTLNYARKALTLPKNTRSASVRT